MSIEGSRYSAGQFHEGELLSAEKINQLGLAADKGHTFHSTGVSTIQGPFGTVFMDTGEVAPSQYYDFPFKVTCAPNEVGAKINVYVRPGTVNNRIPKIGTKYLDNKEPPFLDFSSFPSTGSIPVAIKATKDGVKFFPNTLDIVLFEDGVIPADTDNNGYLVIATITGNNVEGKPSVNGVYQITYSSQVVVRAKPGSVTAVWSWTSR